MLHLLATLGGYAAIGLGICFGCSLFVGLVCIALAERRGPVEDDQFTAEAPYLPDTIKAQAEARAAREEELRQAYVARHNATRDRLAEAHAREEREFRAAQGVR